jgi:hypothetical protein
MGLRGTRLQGSGVNYTRRSLIICYFSPIYYSGDKIEKNEMGGACSTYGGGEAYTVFWWANLSERDHWEDPGVNDGRIIIR